MTATRASGTERTLNAGHWTSRRRRIVAVAGLLLAGVLVAAGVFAFRPRADGPPSPAGDPVAVAKYTATPEFAQLTVEQKEPYLQAVRSNMPALVAAARSGRLTREEQVAAIRNGVKAGARVEARRYFALPPGPARQAHLDRLIEEQERLRGYAAEAADGGPLQFGSGVELKQFVESLPPAERVQMAQFGFDLFQRRLARGLQPWPYGG